MTNYSKTEVAVGAFVLGGAAALAYLAFSLGEAATWFGSSRYPLEARFSTVGELAQGSPVRLAGVTVGEVRAIKLDGFTAVVTLEVQGGVELPSDTAASIETEGLLGEAYVSLSPGGSTDNLAPGESIARTEPPLSLRDLVGKYAFGGGGANEPGGEPEDESPFSDPLE